RDLPSDETAVRSLLTTLVGLQLAGPPEESVIADVADESLVHYGLDEPTLSVGLRYEGDDTTARLLIGDKEPSQQFRYAMIEGEGDVLVIQDRESALNRSLFDLRDRRVLHFETDDVTSLSVENASGETTLLVERASPEEEWRLVVPVEDEAETSRVTSSLSQLRNLRVQDYLVEGATDDDLAALDIASPEVTITLMASGEIQRLLVGVKEGESVVARAEGGDAVFTVPSSTVDSLVDDPFRFQSLSLISVPPEEITRVITEQGGHEIVIEGVESGEGGTVWQAADPPEGWSAEAAEEPLSRLVNALRAMRGRSVLASGEVEGLDSPSIRLTVETTDDEPQLIEVGESFNHDGVQGCAGRRSGRDAALFLESWRVAQITLDFDELIVAPEPPETAPAPVTPEVIAEPATDEVTATFASE
ncbi:DUF4340 domain-containing protein, partial [Candidatus Sumerlaeota bacterium]|nr:DUF4340 domain-containing protein [Candidatus Sumerlaeota bacterium]